MLFRRASRAQQITGSSTTTPRNTGGGLSVFVFLLSCNANFFVLFCARLLAVSILDLVHRLHDAHHLRDLLAACVLAAQHDGHRQQGPGAEACAPVHAAVEARVGVGVRDADGPSRMVCALW